MTRVKRGAVALVPLLLSISNAACSGAPQDAAGETGSPSPSATSNSPDSRGPRGDWIDDLVARPLTNDSQPLVTPTPDGSGQVVEPTVVQPPSRWRGHAYWMVVSPYPGSNDRLENPEILASEDGQTWAPPAGIQNPIASLAPSIPGHLDDATMLYDDTTDELWVYYLYDVATPTRGRYETLLRMRSADGVHWTPPEQVLESWGSYPFVSPSVAKVDGTFYLWTVEVPPEGCFSKSTTVVQRTSSDGVHWGVPLVVPVSIPGHVIWHLNTIAVSPNAGFMSLLAAFPASKDCRSTRLFFADGRGGDDWHVTARALLGPGHGWDSSEIYRSSLLYDAALDRLRVWYSARRADTQEWHIGYAEEALRYNPAQ